MLKNKEKDNEISEIKKDLKDYSEIENAANSIGGKLIVKGLKSDIVSAITSLYEYDKLPEAELRGKCAKLIERIEILKVFINSKSNRKGAQEALKAIEEESEPQ